MLAGRAFVLLFVAALSPGCDAFSIGTSMPLRSQRTPMSPQFPALVTPASLSPKLVQNTLSSLAPPRMMTEGAVVKKESTQRSFVKAVGWRFTAGLVTAATSMYYTGSLAVAASIVGWDLISKSVTMFLGERLWNNVDWGKDKEGGGGDSSQRSLVKALAWRVFAATNTLFAAVVLTKGKAGVAGKIAGSDSVVKTILFYFYERAWATVGWGTTLEPAQDDAAADETAQ